MVPVGACTYETQQWSDPNFIIKPFLQPANANFVITNHAVRVASFVSGANQSLLPSVLFNPFISCRSVCMLQFSIGALPPSSTTQTLQIGFADVSIQSGIYFYLDFIIAPNNCIPAGNNCMAATFHYNFINTPATLTASAHYVKDVFSFPTLDYIKLGDIWTIAISDTQVKLKQNGIEVGGVGLQGAGIQVPLLKDYPLTFKVTAANVYGLDLNSIYFESMDDIACATTFPVGCNAGAYFNPTTDCAYCLPGRFSNSYNVTTCMNCGAGKYAAMANSTICIPCTAGTYSGQTGTSSCSACGANMFSSFSGSSTCSTCLNGTYSLAGGATTCLSGTAPATTALATTLITTTTVAATTTASTTVAPTTKRVSLTTTQRSNSIYYIIPDTQTNMILFFSALLLAGMFL